MKALVIGGPFDGELTHVDIGADGQPESHVIFDDLDSLERREIDLSAISAPDVINQVGRTYRYAFKCTVKADDGPLCIYEYTGR